MERQQQNEQPLPNFSFGHCNEGGNCGEDECPKPWTCGICLTANDSILLTCVNCPGRKDQAASTTNIEEEPPPALPKIGHQSLCPTFFIIVTTPRQEARHITSGIRLKNFIKRQK